jgi:protein translocase SecG subunit
MNTGLTIIQIILSLLLIVLIFLQSSGQDNSRGNIMTTIKFEKRGWEKTMFIFTIIILALFLISSIIQTLI